MSSPGTMSSLAMRLQLPEAVGLSLSVVAAYRDMRLAGRLMLALAPRLSTFIRAHGPP